MDAKRAVQILEENNGESHPALSKYEEQRKMQDLKSDQVQAEILALEKRDIIRMRKRWSQVLLILIAAIVVVDFFVIIAIGYGWMRFENDNIVPLFVGESLIKTLGLAIIVVGFLFNKDGMGRGKSDE